MYEDWENKNSSCKCAFWKDTVYMHKHDLHTHTDRWTTHKHSQQEHFQVAGTQGCFKRQTWEPLKNVRTQLSDFKGLFRLPSLWKRWHSVLAFLTKVWSCCLSKAPEGILFVFSGFGTAGVSMQSVILAPQRVPGWTPSQLLIVKISLQISKARHDYYFVAHFCVFS